VDEVLPVAVRRCLVVAILAGYRPEDDSTHLWTSRTVGGSSASRTSRITDFNIPPAFPTCVGRRFRKTRKDIHLSAVRAHFGTHPEGEFHLVKRAPQVRGRNCANDGSAFVALDTRLISVEDAVQTTTAVRCSESGMG